MLPLELTAMSPKLQQLSDVTANYSWNFDPGLIVALVGCFGLYIYRWREARRQAGKRAIAPRQLAAFSGGIAILFIALISPVDLLGEQLLSMHMLQHILLIDLAPILLILGLSKVFLRPLTRHYMRLEQIAGPLGHPIFAACFYVGSMWFWHLPMIYQLALEHAGWHALEHIQFSIAGALFWWHLLGPIQARQRIQGIGSLIYVGATKMLSGAVGILIAFSPEVLYDFYAKEPRIWGLTTLDDQRLGGAIMELEQSLLFLITVLIVLPRLLDESERRQRRADRYENV